MKNKLLSLIAMALVAIGMQAQTWTAPEAPALPSGNVDYVADGTTGYYLYNVEHKAFVTGANSWATQISLEAAPYLEIVVESMSEDEEETYPGCVKLKMNGAFYFSGDHNRSNYKVENKYLFRDSETSGFIDHASQPVWYWKFTKAESGNYYWQSAPGMGENKFPNSEDQYAAGKGVGTAVVFNASSEDAGIEWQFVSISKDELAAYNKEAALYEARLSLYNLAKLIVDEELNQYGDVNYEAYTEAYNGTSVDDIKAAVTELEKQVIEARKKKAFATGSEDNPTDVTFLLTNPSFTGNDNGWTVDVPGAENKGYQGASYTNNIGDADSNPNYGVSISGFIEAWHPSNGLGNGKIYQTVELPMGKYILSVDVIATNQLGTGKADEGATDSKETVTGFQLYALGGGIDNGVDVSSLNEKPEHYEFEFITAGGTTELGMRMVEATGNWFGADNFTVTYKGDDIDPYYIGLPQLLEKCEAEFENIDEMVANETTKEAYEDAFSAAYDESQIVDGSGEYEKVYKALSDAAEALRASVLDYQRLAVLVNKSKADAEAYAEIEGLGAEVSAMAEQYEEAYTDGIATEEQINEWTANYDAKIVAGVKNALPNATEEKPLRINPLGINLDYAENSDSTGWVVNTGNLGGVYKVNYHNGEVWQDSYSCLQTIANLPAGKYIVKARAFYRDAANADHYENYMNNEAEITTYLVANANMVAVKALAEGAVEAAEAPEGSHYAETVAPQKDEETGEILEPGSGIWLPNSQQGAEWAFNNTEFYQNEVSTYLVNDGDLTFGTRNDDITEKNNQWSLWSKFEVFYAGKSKSGLYEQMLVLKEQAELIFAENNMVTESENKLAAALSAADAVEETASEETITAAINGLTDAMDYYTAGKALIEELVSTVEEYENKLSNLDVEFESTNETFQAILDAYAECQVNEKFASNEQVQGWIDSLPKEWVAYIMAQPSFETASEQTPMDVTEILFNHDFESGNAKYWTVDALGKNNGFQNNNTYTNDLDEENPLPEEQVVTLSNFIESWIPSGSLLSDGAISQKLIAPLPEGYYVLRADGHAVNQNGYPEGGIKGVNLMATDGTNTWSTPMGVPEDVTSAMPSNYGFAFPSDGKTIITIGISVKETNVNWLAADNFKLYYAGTTEPTGVEAIEADNAVVTTKINAIYNLNGQRVSKAVRGLYIINGRKVVVK